MQTLQQYLLAAKKNIGACQLVIMGNEAADLDSMVSAIAYGYLRQQITPALNVLPLMAIPRADFALRSDAVYVFEKARINIQDLLFLDDVNLDSFFESATIVLVDHNKIAMALEKYSAKVSGIIDHHKDEGLSLDASPRIIRTVGSTTSLVAQEFVKAGISINADLAILLGATIILDTVNLSEKAGRVTDVDREMAALLLPLCPISLQDLFDSVQEAKSKESGLSTNDLLRKDYKEWQLGERLLGIASTRLSVSDWFAMDSDLATGFETFCTHRKLDLLLSMNAYGNPDFQRDLVIYTKSKAIHDKLYAYLQDQGLELKRIEETAQQQAVKKGYIAFYSQANFTLSRKKIQPLLADYLYH